MVLAIETKPLPLTRDRDDVICISGTRVTLDTIVEAFLEGATAEEIAQQYPTLSLPDIYSVIGYYLNQKTEVNTYLQQRRRQALRVREQNETQFDPSGVRERLLARKQEQI